MVNKRSRTSLPSPDANGPGSSTVRRILAAAEELFAVQGFEATSMNDVARQCDVSKANIFHHFNSKQDLYMAVLRHASREAAEYLQHPEARKGGFEERFAGYATDLLQSMMKHGPLYRLMLRELLTEKNQAFTTELAQRVLGEKFARLVTILRTGQTRRELRADFDPAMAAIVLIGTNIFFLQCQSLFEQFPDVRFAADPKRYTALLSDILLRGIMPAPKE
jgi:TetR/AcrR family transcriptional regulator